MQRITTYPTSQPTPFIPTSIQETNIDESESEPELFEPDAVLMVTLTEEYPSANQSQITAALEL